MTAEQRGPVRIAIVGASGRMGRRLVALAHQSGQFEVVGAIANRAAGADAGEVAGIGRVGVPIGSELGVDPHVLIDFSVPDVSRHWLALCRKKRIPMVIGTTGLGSDDFGAIEAASSEIPVLQSSNMSPGVTILLELVAQAAKLLSPQDPDIEIVETHHRFKKDAPSGTAASLAAAIQHGGGRSSRRTTIHSSRLGDEVGRHVAYFATLGERLELAHVATDRDVFARGALRAAAWLVTRLPGRYSMKDVLGI